MGMSCASCSARVEKTLNRQPGVRKATVNYASATATVEYDSQNCSPEALQQAVQNAGYDLLIKQDENTPDKVEQAHDKKYRALKFRATWAIVLSVPVMVIGMFFIDMPYANLIMWLFSTPVVFWLGRSFFTSVIETAQRKIEGNNFGIRKSLLEYDQVNNEQREIIYEERRRVLDGESMRGVIMNMLNNRVESIVNKCISDELSPEEWDIQDLNEVLLPIIPVEPVTDTSEYKKKAELVHDIKERAVKLYEAKEAEFPNPEQMREIERVILLRVIDRKWMEHIDDMDQLRQGIGLQAFGNRNPVIEYKMTGYDMFNEMTEAIEEDTVRLLLHVQIEQKIEREQVAKVTGTNKDDSVAKAPVRRETKKIQRNDPCPCGSGLKYKNCCGRNA